MYSNQLSKNKFVSKENTHNFMSFCFFSVITIVSFVGLLLVSLDDFKLLIVALSIIFILSLLKLIMQIR